MAPPLAPPPTAADDATAASLIVFERLRAAIAVLARGRERDDTARFEEELRHCLQADELINITARTTFEWRVARHLASGWQAGNETLFPAAMAVFAWETERRRLQPFGRFGAFLDQAIEERRLFEQQGDAVKKRQRQIMQRLRYDAASDADRLALDAPHLAALMERFPGMLFLVVPAQAVNAWREQFSRLPVQVKQAAAQPAAPAHEPVLHMGEPGSNGGRSAFGGVTIVFILLACFVRFWFSTVNAPAPPRPLPGVMVPVATLPPQQAVPRTVPPEVLPPAAPVQPAPELFGAAYRQAISDDIRYQPLDDQPAGEYRARFAVHVDAKGKIASATLLDAAADPRYARAVKEAILRAPRLTTTDGAAYNATLGFTVRIRPHVSQTRLDAIWADLHYKRPPEMPVGDYVAQFDVKFDRQGKPRSAALVKGSPDPQYDMAAHDAILRADPVPTNLGREWSTRITLGTVFSTRKKKDAGQMPASDDSTPPPAGGARE